MKKMEMVWLPLPMVIVGVLMAKMSVLLPPGILFLTESMSIRLLALENKEDGEKSTSSGLLAL